MKRIRNKIAVVSAARPLRNCSPEPFDFRLDGAITPLERILERLDDPTQQSSGQYSAVCPAHEDSNASLSIKENDNGSVVLHCFAGCLESKVLESLDLRLCDLGRGKRGNLNYTLPLVDLKEQSESDAETRDGVISVSLVDAPESAKPWNNLHRGFTRILQDWQLSELSDELGVSQAALKMIGAGFDTGTRDFTFPEYDGSGRLCGIATRGEMGKKFKSGGKRGLIIPGTLRCVDGDTLLLVEGQTDVAALCDLKLKGLGRPSNVGGVEHLLECLKRVPLGCDIVVVGENDRKKDGSWPGRDGARTTAEKLSAGLDRAILWALVPDGCKDTRAWLEKQSRDSDVAKSKLGMKLVAGLKQNAAICQPAYWSRFAPLSTEDFLRKSYKHEWLVKDVLVGNQITVIGGPKKALKTSIAIDLAVSLATGTPFLGQFSIPSPVKVGVFSGESGEATIQETLRRVMRARIDCNVDMKAMPIYWEFSLPSFTEAGDLEGLAFIIRKHALQVVFIDPLYLCALSGSLGLDASNLYHMGPLLANAAKCCLASGATPIFVHHTKKFTGKVERSGTKPKTAEPLDLDDLSYSGIAEVTRQWVLISRRAGYQPGTGRHDLWLSFGGSAGHSGLYRLLVNEGALNDDFGGRTWNVDVQTQSEAIEEEQEHQVEQREATKDDAKFRILDALERSEFASGATKSDLRDTTHLGGARIAPALEELLVERRIEECKVEKMGGRGMHKYGGFRLVRGE